MHTTPHIFHFPVSWHLPAVWAGTLVLLTSGLFASVVFAADDTRLLRMLTASSSAIPAPCWRIQLYMGTGWE